MTIRYALTAALVGLGLQGCVVYDSHCRRGDCRHDHGDWDTTTDFDTGVEEPPELNVELSLSPSSGEQGQTLIASLVVTGDLDNTDVLGMEFLGDDVTVLAADARDTELLVTLSIASDAALGSADALIEVAGYQPILFTAAFEVLEASGSIVDDPTDTGDTHDTAEDPCEDTGA